MTIHIRAGPVGACIDVDWSSEGVSCIRGRGVIAAIGCIALETRERGGIDVEFEIDAGTWHEFVPIPVVTGIAIHFSTVVGTMGTQCTGKGISRGCRHTRRSTDTYGCRGVAVAFAAGPRERSSLHVVVVMALITVFSFRTGMFRRVYSTRWWYIVASLADTGPLLILILALAACVAEINLAGDTIFGNISANQINVSSLGVVRVILVIIYVRAMTIGALDVLVLIVMAFLIGVTVCTEIRLIVLPTGNFCTMKICTKDISITGTQVCVVGWPIDGRTA